MLSAKLILIIYTCSTVLCAFRSPSTSSHNSRMCPGNSYLPHYHLTCSSSYVAPTEIICCHGECPLSCSKFVPHLKRLLSDSPEVRQLLVLNRAHLHMNLKRTVADKCTEQYNSFIRRVPTDGTIQINNDFTAAALRPPFRRASQQKGSFF
ncbi:hypothetical protein F5J12DRAFT_815100 [Pisolithus orientalis]|uniref:uncharacterized protein n=1 Tax=Pisolithus orientalis TaxID=936130 RepID=UPI002225890D|nr:uncharacterized protein F5J12DRAFT_815100 [Pisolithus orientalis]KAI6014985.1 hypothetical protein F5J12DRAFT_815100 [Pisolithus orientalis]